MRASDQSNLLQGLVALAPATMPGIAAASLALLRENYAVTVVCADERARAVDDCQYGDGDGFYLQVAGTGQALQINDLGDPQQPTLSTWRRTALDNGFRALLSIPVPVAVDIVAALNLFAVLPTEWDDEIISLAQSFAMVVGETITVQCRVVTS